MDTLRLFWHQRRRGAVVVGMAFATGAVLDGGQNVVLAPLMALCFAALLAASILLVPQTRTRVTALTALFLLAAVVDRIVPGALFPLMLAAVVALATVSLPQHWIEAVRLPGIVQAHASRRIAASSQALWDLLFPAETHVHWDPAIAGIIAGRRPGYFVVVADGVGYGRGVNVPIQVYDVEPGQTFKIRDMSQLDAADGGPVRVIQYSLQSVGGETVLSISEGVWHTPVLVFLTRWLDDWPNDELEHVAAHVEDRPDGSLMGRDTTAHSIVFL